MVNFLKSAGVAALTAETASEYDFMVIIDGSGSMGTASVRNPRQNRWEEQQEHVIGLASAFDKLDDDGIDIIICGPRVDLFEGVTSKKASEIFSSRGPAGGTPMTEAVMVAIDKQKRTGKKTFVTVFTDGEPNDPNSLELAITRAANNIATDESLTFLFIQVGDDRRARAYLDRLDNAIKAKFDIVHVVSAEEAEVIAPLDLITRAING